MNMSDRRPRFALALTLLAILAGGCATNPFDAGSNLPVVCRPDAVRPLLVLPAISPATVAPAAALEMGEQFFLALNAISSRPVIHAPAVAELQPFVLASLLRRDGKPDVDELVALATGMNCESVVFIDILAIQPFPPFRVALDLRLYDGQNGALGTRCRIDLWLRDAVVASDYRRFVSSFQEDADEAAMHVALLSPATFLHYVAARSARMLLADMENLNRATKLSHRAADSDTSGPMASTSSPQGGH